MDAIVWGTCVLQDMGIRAASVTDRKCVSPFDCMGFMHPHSEHLHLFMLYDDLRVMHPSIWKHHGVSQHLIVSLDLCLLFVPHSISIRVCLPCVCIQGHAIRNATCCLWMVYMYDHALCGGGCGWV